MPTAKAKKAAPAAKKAPAVKKTPAATTATRTASKTATAAKKAPAKKTPAKKPVAAAKVTKPTAKAPAKAAAKAPAKAPAKKATTTAATKATSKKAPAKKTAAGKDEALSPKEMTEAAALEQDLEAELKEDLKEVEEEKKNATFTLSDSDDSDEPVAQVTQAGATADPVKDYLKQIGKVPLLNAEQEVELAKRIEAGLFAEEKLAENPDLDTETRIKLEWIA